MRSYVGESVTWKPVATTIASTQDAYNERLQEQLATTVWNTGGCVSWYLDAQGRNTTLWPTFTFAYRRLTRRFDLRAYRSTARADRGSRNDQVFPGSDRSDGRNRAVPGKT